MDAEQANGPGQGRDDRDPRRQEERTGAARNRLGWEAQKVKSAVVQQQKRSCERESQQERHRNLPDLGIWHAQPEKADDEEEQVAEGLQGEETWTQPAERSAEKDHLVTSRTSSRIGSLVACTPGWYMAETRAGLISKEPGLTTWSR